MRSPRGVRGRRKIIPAHGRDQSWRTNQISRVADSLVVLKSAALADHCPGCTDNNADASPSSTGRPKLPQGSRSTAPRTFLPAFRLAGQEAIQAGKPRGSRLRVRAAIPPACSRAMKAQRCLPSSRSTRRRRWRRPQARTRSASSNACARRTSLTDFGAPIPPPVLTRESRGPLYSAIRMGSCARWQPCGRL